MRKTDIIIILCILLFSIGQKKAFSQIITNNLNAWYIADSCYTDVSDIFICPDNSLNNNTLSQVNIANQPLLSETAFNNHKSIIFDGTNDYIENSSYTLDQEFSVIVLWTSKIQMAQFVFSSINSILYAHYPYHNNTTFKIHAGRTGGYSVQYQRDISIGYTVNSYLFDPVLSSIYQNNLLMGSYDIGTNGIDGLRIGASSVPHFFLNGEIAEIIIYDTILSDEDRLQVENYLMDKYSTPLELGEDFSIDYGYCDTILTVDTSFHDVLWSTGETSDTIYISQAGEYSVQASDIFNRTLYDTIQVTRTNIPNQLNDSLICLNETITWDSEITGNYTYQWYGSAELTSSIEISEAGQYALIITDNQGCKYYSDTITVTIDDYPTTTSLGSDKSLCAGQTLYLETGADQTTNYLWSNGETEDHIVIQTSGDYHLTATNSIGCIATDTINIQIQGYAPLPGFLTENLCLGDMTQFTDTSQAIGGATITAWHWDFGDSETSDAQNPTHSYTDAGTYQVRLLLTTDNACENTLLKNIQIYPNPVTSFHTSQLCQGNKVNFINTSTSELGDIVYNRWDFGNNDTSLESSTQHLFDTDGNVQVQLKTKTIYGCADVLDTILTIKPSPVADFVNSAVCQDDSTNFYQQTSISGIMSISSWLWQTSTGLSSSEAEPIFLFPNSGNIEVSLIANAVNGCSDTIAKQLHVYKRPLANFNIGDLCQANVSTIHNESTDSDGSIEQHYWWLNSSLISQKNELTFLPADTGKNSLKLKVISSTACSDTLSKDFTINPRPIGSYKVSENYTTPNRAVLFTADSININHRYAYNFGNGNISNQAVSSSLYSNSGDYDTKLIVENQFACQDSSEVRIRVVEPMLNLAISELKTFSENGKTKLSVLLTNVGNLDIEGLTYQIEMNNNTVFEETQNDVRLKIGASKHDTLASQFLFDAKQSHFLCVSVFANDNFDDVDIEDNIYCISHQQEEQILKIYPNPFANEFIIVYRSEKEEMIDYQIVDTFGKTVKADTFEAIKGVQKYRISANYLSSGIYTLIIGNSIKKLVRN